MDFVFIHCPLDEWMKYLYLYPIKGVSLTMWILQDILPSSADLSILYGQEELLAALGISVFLSYSMRGDKTLFIWITNPIPIPLTNNLRKRY
jgi:hypothetical protein